MDDTWVAGSERPREGPEAVRTSSLALSSLRMARGRWLKTGAMSNLLAGHYREEGNDSRLQLTGPSRGRSDPATQ